MTSRLDPLPAPIDCDTAVRRLWDFLDEELDATRMAEVEAHLAACLHCPAHFDFAREMLTAVSAAREEDAAEPSALAARVVAALRREGYRPLHER